MKDYEYMKDVIKHSHFIDAGPTIEFCLMIDATFDILNIRSPHGKYLKGPLSQKNEVIIILKLIIKIYNNILIN